MRIALSLIESTTSFRSPTLSAAEQAALRELRFQMAQASIGTPFDVRHVLGMHPNQYADWRGHRCAWLAELFAADARVVVDSAERLMAAE